MQKRFLAIWFPYLRPDWFIRRRPALHTIPFVLVSPDHGRMIVTATNVLAQMQKISIGITAADARTMIPSLEVLDDKPELNSKLLKGIAEWCIRYTPEAAIDIREGLMLHISGCAHLWGGEKQYLADIRRRLNAFGYHNRVAIADTIGTAWAIARFGSNDPVIETGEQKTALLPLPPAALRLEPETGERLEKLGLRKINDFINMPRTALRRRFGQTILLRLDQALGFAEEQITPVHPIEPYQERLPCLEPILTAKGIEIALQKLLEAVCHRLQHEQNGLRYAVFKCYRTDGKIETMEIGTNSPSCNSKHLFKLFEIKIDTLQPAPGIELFMLEAPKVEALSIIQENLWENSSGIGDIHLSELLDRIAVKTGITTIQKYVPDEHYWPECSYKLASCIREMPETNWKVDRPRPVQLLASPQPIEVTAPIPDYPPMLFRYKGRLHKIIKADGPERIEQEWWLQQGQHRDYYYVEDEEGHRYWLFRSGHYDMGKTYQWFLHGFFA